MTLPAWREEPISRQHDRESFDCGDAAMNDFLRRFARENHASGGPKTFLAFDDADNIPGFYGLGRALSFMPPRPA